MCLPEGSHKRDSGLELESPDMEEQQVLNHRAISSAVRDRSLSIKYY